MSEGNQTGTQTPVYSVFSDDPDFAELLQMFAFTLSERGQSFQESFRAGEIEQVQTQAHQLKGTGGSYGFEGLTKVAAELEDACKANDVERVGKTLDPLLEYISRIAV